MAKLPLVLLVVASLLAFTHQETVNYCTILHNSLLFYEAQRSGRLPATNRVEWRGDSALGDCGDPCTTDSNGDGNLAGGYYDAGDHVKFGLPGAWALTTLAWGLIEFETAVTSCGELSYYKDTLKWGLDWWIKAHPSANELYGQVGDGNTDHAWWGPPELMTMDRPSFKLSTDKPGTELAMEAAAAFAAGSIVFASDTTYSATLLAHATDLWNFGKTYKGSYVDSIPNVANFYNSWSGFNDEIVWATLWMYRATGTESYLTQAKSDYATYSISNVASTNSFDWDNKAAGAVILIAKLTNEAAYKTDAKNWLNYWRPNGGVTYTPGGLAWKLQWGPCRYAANAAFLAAVNNAAGDNAWAETQINYMVGVNNNQQSFIVGFGPNHPINPHHRAAHHSLTNDINDPVNNVYILLGALVGGPDSSDSYTDDRTNYVSNEVALDYNAGFTGAVAALAQLYPDGINTNATIPSTTGSATSTTTGGSGSGGPCGAGTAARAGCSGVGLTVNTGVNQFWYAINFPVEGISAAVQTMEIRDSSSTSYSSWNYMTWETWEAWSFAASGTGLTFPISLRITLCNGEVLTLDDVISSLSEETVCGSPVYSTTGGGDSSSTGEYTTTTGSPTVSPATTTSVTPATTTSAGLGGTTSTGKPDYIVDAAATTTVNLLVLMPSLIFSLVLYLV